MLCCRLIRAQQPSLTLKCHGHCDSTPLLFPPLSFLYFACSYSLPVSADERERGVERTRKTTAKEIWAFFFYIPFIIATLPFCAESSADWTIFSDSESRAEVASSRSRIGGLRTSALQHTTNRFTSYLALCHFCGAHRMPQSPPPFLSYHEIICLFFLSSLLPVHVNPSCPHLIASLALAIFCFCSFSPPNPAMEIF